MLNLIFTITTFLIPLFAFSLGIFCFLNNPKSKVVIMHFLLTMAIGIWGLGLFLLMLVDNQVQAIQSNYLLYFGASLIPILFYHFITIFLYKERKFKISIFAGYLLSLFFLIITFIPPWLISGVSGKNSFDYWVDPGILYIPFLIYFWIYIIFAIYLLVKAYKQSEGIIKRRIIYLLLAVTVAIIGGGTNFLPQLFGIYPFGNFITFLYPILITYGVFLDKG